MERSILSRGLPLSPLEMEGTSGTVIRTKKAASCSGRRRLGVEGMKRLKFGLGLPRDEGIRIFRPDLALLI